MSTALTLYYRVGCHLCDDMIASIEDFVTGRDWQLDLVDIDRDEALRQRFNADVPVLCHDGKVICKHFLDVARLQQILDA